MAPAPPASSVCLESGPPLGVVCAAPPAAPCPTGGLAAEGHRSWRSQEPRPRPAPFPDSTLKPPVLLKEDREPMPIFSRTELAPDELLLATSESDPGHWILLLSSETDAFAPSTPELGLPAMPCRASAHAGLTEDAIAARAEPQRPGQGPPQLRLTN
eukprot:CAMPEP_0176226770 /NCGR_PEP_ID=MMETSP0121_2-20121125/22428_1 /TAXON_ID=160619 /ORGANISM="Kryptoperidinium foliaceum, Strain CCMP 1326" /LENGTH=156 /DNA_ID=CAMNT_0017566039 /DNA_START=94 /DNA_END=561 /DNA_ORIENTATION=+